MTDRAKKISELTALTHTSGDDLLVIVDDPSGTPETKRTTVTNFFANVAPAVNIKSTLTVNGSITLAGNTSITKQLNVSNSVSVVGNTNVNGFILVANSAVVNSTGYWVGNPSGLKGDTGSTGIKGDKGDTGSTGTKGDKGDTGDKGDAGDKGNTGSTPVVPGPYTDDSDAASNGVAVGELYYNGTGIVYVRLT